MLNDSVDRSVLVLLSSFGKKRNVWIAGSESKFILFSEVFLIVVVACIFF